MKGKVHDVKFVVFFSYSEADSPLYVSYYDEVESRHNLLFAFFFVLCIYVIHAVDSDMTDQGRTA